MLSRWVPAIAVAAALVCAGCGGSSSSARGTASAPTAPPTTADPWAIPATITPDYINKVLAKLNQIDGDAFRDARVNRAVTPRYRSLEAEIRASAKEVDLRAKDTQVNVGTGFAGVATVPGDRKMHVVSILSAPTPCVFAAVDVDFHDVTPQPIHYPPWFVALVPHNATEVNPTRWAFADDGFERDGASPSATEACAVS